jgi:hypothetical protein
MAKKETPKTKGRKKWPKGPKQPVVFMFQPTEYEFVPPERLKEWVKAMRERVGFPAELVERMAGSGGETNTYNGGEYVD